MSSQSKDNTQNKFIHQARLEIPQELILLDLNRTTHRVIQKPKLSHKYVGSCDFGNQFELGSWSDRWGEDKVIRGQRE